MFQAARRRALHRLPRVTSLRYPERISGKVVREWERKLVPFGLALNQQRQQWIQDIVTWPDGRFQHYQFDRELDGPWFVRNAKRLPYQSATNFSLVPTRGQERTPAEWVMSDEKVRAYLLYRFPALHTSPRKRKYAARVALLLYLWFRVGCSAEEIGEIMGMRPICVQVKASAERRLAQKFFERENPANSQVP